MGRAKQSCASSCGRSGSHSRIVQEWWSPSSLQSRTPIRLRLEAWSSLVAYTAVGSQLPYQTATPVNCDWLLANGRQRVMCACASVLHRTRAIQPATDTRQRQASQSSRQCFRGSAGQLVTRVRKRPPMTHELERERRAAIVLGRCRADLSVDRRPVHGRASSRN